MADNDRWLRINRTRILLHLPRTGEDAIAWLWLFTIALIGIVGLTHPYNQQDHPNRYEQTTGETSTSQENSAPQKQTNGPQNELPHWYAFLSSPLAPDWVLAVLGVAAAILALLTLLSIQSQSKAAVRALELNRRSANAAKTSADAVMLAERAYIAISHHPPGLEIEDLA